MDEMGERGGYDGGGGSRNHFSPLTRMQVLPFPLKSSFQPLWGRSALLGGQGMWGAEKSTPGIYFQMFIRRCCRPCHRLV